jgi:hypothetical protein
MIVPKHISLHNWAASLVIDFPDDDIPLLDDFDDNWQKWGAALVQCNSFGINNAPSPDLSLNKRKQDWHEWAMMIYLTMIDYS